MKKVSARMAAIILAVGLTGCGRVSYDDITGDWTTKTVNGLTVEEYADSLGVDKTQAATNMTITDDDKIASASAGASQNFVYARKSDGIEVKEEDNDAALMFMKYDKDAKTLTYSVDLGSGQTMTIVMEKGKADLTAAETTDGAASDTP